jgi:uncharacterized protein (TIGR00299 family) protein
VTTGARLLVFDCFSGIAGDMVLAALIDAGASLDEVRAGLANLHLPPFELATERVTRGGLAALRLIVNIPGERPYQPDEMRSLVTSSSLPERVQSRSLAAIDALAEGEATAHGSPHPYLHEAGAVDTMIDVVGSMLALESLAIDAAFCPVVTVGSGTIVRAEHGPLPAAPGPAAAAILQCFRFPLRFVDAAHELVTPTGAAILAAVASPGPATLVVDARGVGAGTFDPPGRPNALRVFIGAPALSDSSLPSVPSTLPVRALVELAANIDDMPPALLAHARDRLIEEGALDAWIEPIGMKKGRSASKLCALVAPEDEQRFAALFLNETTTLGVRVATHRRYEAVRHVETFKSSLGELRIKVSEAGGRRRATPEFEDIRALAARLGLPAIVVQRTLESELLAAFGA